MELYLHSPIRFHGVHSEDFTVLFMVLGTITQKLAKSLEVKGMLTIHGVCL